MHESSTMCIEMQKPNKVQNHPGEILIDNHNIKDLDLKFLRRNVGAVSQEPSLFTGTIKDNMKVGNTDADDQQIQSAAVMANAHSFISQFPNQYLTEVSYLSLIWGLNFHHQLIKVFNYHLEY